MKKRITFDFVNTEEEAVERTAYINNKYYSDYMRKNHPARYSSWVSENGKEHKFIVWYKENC